MTVFLKLCLKLPLTQEKLNIFLTTLKSILPDVDISLNHEDDDNENFVKDDAAENFYQKIDSENVDDFIEDSQDSKPSIKLDKVSVTNQSAIILTKRPSITAGVLHELTQIAEKPSGVFRETALSVVNDEYLRGIGKLFDKSGKEKERETPKPEVPTVPPSRQKKPAPFRFRRGGENSISAAFFFLPKL